MHIFSALLIAGAVWHATGNFWSGVLAGAGTFTALIFINNANVANHKAAIELIDQMLKHKANNR